MVYTSGDEKDGSKRRAEEAFMSPLEVMRQKYKRKKASATTRQKDTLSKLVSLLAKSPQQHSLRAMSHLNA